MSETHLMGASQMQSDNHIQRASHAARETQELCASHIACETHKPRATHPGESDGKTCNRNAAATAIVASGSWQPHGLAATLCGPAPLDLPTMVNVLGYPLDRCLFVEQDAAEFANAVSVAAPGANILLGDIGDLEFRDIGYLNLDFQGNLVSEKALLSRAFREIPHGGALSITWCHRGGRNLDEGRLLASRRNRWERMTTQMAMLAPMANGTWQLVYRGAYVGKEGSLMYTVAYRRVSIRRGHLVSIDFVGNKNLARMAEKIRKAG